MCGIVCSLSNAHIVNWQQLVGASSAANTALSPAPALEDVRLQLLRRGPDHMRERIAGQVHSGEGWRMCSTTLQVRGTHAAFMPLEDSAGNVLCFNGEIFGGLPIAQHDSDSTALLSALAAAAEKTSLQIAAPEAHPVLELVLRLRGPYAFTFWHAAQQRMYVARDPLGRRSLLVHYAATQLTIVSVAPLGVAPACTPGGQPSGADDAASLGVDEDRNKLRNGDSSGQRLEGVYLEVAPGLHVLEQAGRDSRDAVHGESQAHSSAAHGDCGGDSISANGNFSSEHHCGTAEGESGTSHRSVWTVSCLSKASSYQAWQRTLHQERSEKLLQDLQLLACPAIERVEQHHELDTPASRQLAEPAAQQQPANDPSRNLAAAHALRCPVQACITSLEAQWKAYACRIVAGALQRAVDARCSLIDAQAGRATTWYEQHADARLCHGVHDHCDVHTTATLPHSAHSLNASQAQATCKPASCQHAASGDPAAVSSSSALTPARVLLLFSGGLDSTVLAAMAHRCVPADEPIDLVNVCFAAGASPDRQSSLDALEELACIAPARQWRLICMDATLDDVDANRERLLSLLAPSASHMDLNIGAALWLAARAHGTVRTPSGQQAAGGEEEARLAPSGQEGGTEVDEAVSGQKRGQEGASSGTHVDAAASGQQRGSAPSQQDSSSSKPQQPGLTQEGPEPAASKADARRGVKSPAPSDGMYYSQARVVLLGHGADEVFGGYGRHRTAERHGGRAALQAELALDMQRLWVRNLGRDDRLVADCSREARHPFLDEELLAAVAALPLDAVADLRQPAGVGDKAVLLEVARTLGLHRAAARRKRAIQFGSRIAKQANVRDFGSNRAANRQKVGGLPLSKVGRQAQCDE